MKMGSFFVNALCIVTRSCILLKPLLALEVKSNSTSHDVVFR